MVQKVSVALGGTGAATASTAQTNLDVPGLSIVNDFTNLQSMQDGIAVTGARTSDVGANELNIDFSAGGRFETNADDFIFNTGANGSNTQFKIKHVANVTDWIEISGVAGPGNTIIEAVGSGTNIGINFKAKGAAAIRFLSGSGSYEQLRIADATTAVNYWNFKGNVTGSGPLCLVSGSDSNVNVDFSAKGPTGLFRILYNEGAEDHWRFGGQGGGSKVAFISDSATAPTSNPTGGGYLYCESGALKYRSAGGNVFTIVSNT